MRTLITFQPVGVAVNVPPCFEFYESGVLREEDCTCAAAPKFKRQAATLVGYSTDAKSVPGCDGWWILKNSYGPKWGEDGYIRLCNPTDAPENSLGTCNVLQLAMIPNVGLIPEI
jgi:cathepsin L